MDAAGSLKGAAKYDCLLFDMDDTLYPISTGLNLICRKNIQDFMLEHLKIEESEVPKLCLELYNNYGTTMAGLKAIGYEFSNDDFHAFVHGRLPYDETLTPDTCLRKLLLTIPLRKIIFTNADKDHAAKVLKRLDLEDCFEGIICFETLNPPLPLQPDESDMDESKTEDGSNRSSVPQTKILCKPSLEAMEAAMRIANIDPEKTVFFDDSVRNIASGKNAGLHTVLVGSPELVEEADFALESLHNIKEALPEIWEGAEEEDHLEKILQANAVETVIYV